jgi:type II secretory pathway pseudopilin PulG
MANQAIALQARAPQQGNFLAPAMQQAGQMINQMAQQKAAERQTAVAQQQMELAKAKEGREAAMAPAQQAEAGAKAGSAKVKYVSDFMDTSALALANVRDPQQAMAVGDRLKQLFPEPEFQQSVNETIAYLTEDPAQFDARRQESLVRTLDAKDQLAKTFETQKTGTQQRTVQYSPYGGAATEVPGSRFDTAQDIQYVKGPDDSVRAMPKNMPGTGGFGAPAPASPAAGLVGGARGGALGPSIEQAAQRLSPGLVVSGRARTPERNAQVGGVPDSFHKTDNARDFQPGKGQTLTGLYNSLAPLKAQGFDVIKERNHVHVEPSPGKAPAARGSAGGLQFGQVVPGMGGGGAKAKDLTVSEQTASYNIKRLLRGADAIKKAVGRTPGANVPSAAEAAVGSLPFISKAVNFTRGEDRQIVAAAQRDVLDALLYLATGAAYNKEQLEGQMESYIPAYSDEPGAIESKRERLAQLVTDAKTRAGRGWTPELDKAASTLFSSQTPVATAKPAATPTAPKIGAVAEGHRFKGGDPANPKNWEKVR